MAYPKDLKYEEHEWVQWKVREHRHHRPQQARRHRSSSCRSVVSAGKSFGTVESVKAVSELYAPVSGSVTAVNEALNTAPEKINTEPHSAWMIKVKIKDKGELNNLLSADDYDKFVAEEGH
jgi:glycine cleavage system H protein